MATQVPPAGDSACRPQSAISPRSEVFSNIVWLLGDKFLALAIGLLIFGCIARVYGPVGSGNFAYAAALLQIGLSLSLVCAGTALLPRFCRMLAGHPAALAGAIANVFVLRLVACTVATAAMMLFTVLVVQDPDRRTVTLLMLLAVPLIEPFYIFATYWLSRNNNKPTVIARSSGLLIRCVAVLLGAWWGAPIWMLALAWLLESAVNATLQVALTRPALPQLSWLGQVRLSRIRSYLAFGIRFTLGMWLSQLFLRLDRLLLAELLSPYEFGIYAAPMQLVEVWSQVAYLIGSSIATAYLYKRLDDAHRTRAFLVTAAAMAGIGLLGLLGAWLLGAQLLSLVYGSAFTGSVGFLVAGSALAVLLFADQAVDMLVLANDQPWLLASKWTVALVVALLVLVLGFPRWGAYAGPLALSAGILSAWLALLLAPRAWRHSGRARRDSRRVSSSQSPGLPTPAK